MTRIVAVLFFLTGFTSSTYAAEFAENIALCDSDRISQQAVNACDALFRHGVQEKWLYLAYGEKLNTRQEFTRAKEVLVAGAKYFPESTAIESLMAAVIDGEEEKEWMKQYAVEKEKKNAASDLALQIKCGTLSKISGLQLPDECELWALAEAARVEPTKGKDVANVTPEVVANSAPEIVASVDPATVSGNSKLTIVDTPGPDSAGDVAQEPSIQTATIEEVAPVAAAPQVRKIALLVGNGTYKHIQPLDNPTNDMQIMADALAQLDFEVIAVKDVKSKRDFKDAVRRFQKELNGDESTVGLFFYAGHAVQVNGENYLIPTESEIYDIPDLDDETITLTYITAMAGLAGNITNMFFIDACRDNPFPAIQGLISAGLARQPSPEGSVLVFATGPGKTAGDGYGENSPFTESLVKNMGQKNKHVLLMLQDVVKDVRKLTRKQQTPWIQSSLYGDFFFAN